ncbi:hypothetical protein [Amycolatopsis azurea]|uniref:Uncharacterized protein n=1 Tax=Amycolatopsis azurea DSM 43854 TaxID=1238180 RepID=M2QC21_9PSEU|nr:hypothetical protein [Amycolatopsis azurea]EMD23642.1 hypothetical protein C791_7032 [Amycolatopsis azurea DSM 43854]OOC01090.1 hypothetical protein B0293_39425 [Amycolatopsis azurea DSM 43854]
MKLRHAFTTLAVATGLMGVFAPVATADEPIASIDFSAEQGAFPVDGKSGYWVGSPEHEVMIREVGDVVRVDADADNGQYYLRLDFSAPTGALQVGPYEHAGGARIHAIATGLGCLDDYSTFTISRIERSAEGLTALDATFEQRCGSPAAPALRGEVRYRR